MSKKDVKIDRNFTPHNEEITLDAQDLIEMLDQYDVEYPSNLQIEATIDAIRPFMPLKREREETLYEKTYSLLKRSYHEFFHLSFIFWIANSLFLLFGLTAVVISKYDPYLTVLVLAPIPFLLGLVELFKSRDSGMAELELTMKHSFQEIILSKMVIIGGYNLVINVVLMFFIHQFSEQILLSKLFLYWMTPFTVVSVLGFLIASQIRSSYTVLMIMLTWILIGAKITQSKWTVEWLNQIHFSFYIILNIVAASLFILRFYFIYKRGVSFESHN